MKKTIRPERVTQNRVIQLFEEELGYSNLGNWEHRENNSNFEEEYNKEWLLKQGHSGNIISKVLHKVKNVIHEKGKSLYDINKAFYLLLRYGVNVQSDAGQNKQTIYLIDWEEPQNNDFAIAEEVTIQGVHNKRPDIVLYINGIALGVLELKRSNVSVSEGIRQNLDNQKHLFIQSFFNTIQFVMAGNDFEGLRYGAIDANENFFLRWKEVSREKNPNDKYLLSITEDIRKQADKAEFPLDKNIIEILNKDRFLELVHDFIVFDGGDKKLCRPNQYFGVKASQDFIQRKEGGIIWHTQGSGKSLTMVWLTKWIREFNHNARVLIVTDREELDSQIEKVYGGVSETIYRTKSGKDLLEKLADTSPWLICSLVHKFRDKEDGSEEDFINELEKIIPSGFKAQGDIYVFVDECHRTQSGKLHSAMKEILPDALFIGFTGTPLLKKDKKQSAEVFGPFIHTYKFDEAVLDKVVLDLRYEARDVEQKISSPDRIDEWFEVKTRGLSKYARDDLMNKWGTLKKVFSSRSRLEKIVMDINLDMATKERLANGKGNAMLVSDSIYNACRYYDLFQKSGLTKCAIITSFSPNHADIKGEESGLGETEKIQRYDIYKKMLADYFQEDAEKSINKVELFEKEVKQKFVNEPGQMKLLIVVSKLLTGFDAPPATYLYIDKRLKDHGLFQAVCRVNRLDGEDKDYGYIVDYMDLFKSLEGAFHDYTSEALAQYDKADVDGLLKDRIVSGREELDEALEAAHALCEPVMPPKNEIEYIHYFCGDETQNPLLLEETEARRIALYKHTSALVRAYANIANEMEQAGYSKKEIERIQAEVSSFESIKKLIQLVSGDYVSLKKYEPAMRQLIDNYIGAEESRMLANFNDLSLVELLIQRGKDALNDLPESIKKNKVAMAETIENNIRRIITDERDTNPAHFDKMSELLINIIERRKDETLSYEKYLQEIIELSKKVKREDGAGDYPKMIDTLAKRVWYDNLGQNEELSLELDETIKNTKKDSWRSNPIKTREVRYSIQTVLDTYGITGPDLETILNLAKNQSDY